MTRPVRPAPRLRALGSGVVCSAGAMAAHALAGGASPGPAALLVLPLAVALHLTVVRRTADPAALGAVALLSQLGWHGLLMVGPGSTSLSAAHSGPRMLAAHLAVAAATVAICLGLERALLHLLAERALRLLAPVLAPAMVTPFRRPVSRTAYGVAPLALRWAATGGVRGPPTARNVLVLG